MDHCRSMIIDGTPIKVLEVDVKPSIIEENTTRSDFMEFTRIGEKNYDDFRDIVFLENHTAGIPMIMLGVIEEARPIAAAVLEVDARVSRLISIYVEKSYRKQGIGAELIQRLSDFSRKSGYKTMEIDFISTQDLQGFFEKVGFTLLSGNEVLYLPMDQVINTNRFHGFLEKADSRLHCVPFSGLTPGRLFVAYEKLGLLYDGSIEVLGDLSALLMTGDGQPVGLMTLQRAGEDLIITELYSGEYGYGGYSVLFGFLYNRLKDKQGRDLAIGFIGADDDKLALVSEIAGDMIEFEKGETIFHGVL